MFPNTNVDADTLPMMVKLMLVLTKLDKVGKLLVKYIFNLSKILITTNIGDHLTQWCPPD